jgi:hypothetical protein
MGDIVELAKNAVIRQVNILEKTLTMSIKIFDVVVVGLDTSDLVKDL